MKTLINAAAGTTDYGWVTDGMEVWASAHEPTADKATYRLRQLPVRGIAHYAKYLPDDGKVEPTPMRARYFTPFVKDGARLMESKTVAIRSRDISSTREEAIESYNARVQAQIEWFQNRADSLRTQFI